MINPNGENFPQNNPAGGQSQEQSTTGTASSSMGGGPLSGGPTGEPAGSAQGRLAGVGEKVSHMAGDAWKQTRQTAGTARERTEFFLRENPVPTVIGALAIGLAIGLAIRYSSEHEREVQARTSWGDVNLGMLSMPFLWPFFRNVKETVKDRYEDSAEAVREGVDRLRHVDVNRYAKPLQKKWRNWTH
jgi:ElaB/YqjD/DUF883 family membrane-anchored ribosome-binding protein